MEMADRQAWLVVLAAAVCTAAVGCSRETSFFPHEPGKPLVISLGGVGGETRGTEWLRQGLHDAGVPCVVVGYPWSRGLDGLYVEDLWDVEGNRRRAAELAGHVAQYRRLHPETPIYLEGHSGGAAIALFALEALPAGVAVDSALLLAPAVSPDYDLATALQHVRQHLFVTASPADVVFLGAGTRVMGTMDGPHVEAAGREGFHVPDDLPPADRAEYRKVRQARWTWHWLLKGHYGGHFSANTPWFARQYLAPIIRGDPPPDAFVSLVDD